MDLYLYTARLAARWNRNENIGLVVGATSAAELEKVRAEAGPEIPILIPGVGAQGGDLERSFECGSNGGGELAIINVARGIIYAGGGENYQTEIRKAAKIYLDRIHVIASKKSNLSRTE